MMKGYEGQILFAPNRIKSLERSLHGTNTRFRSTYD